MLLRKLDCYVRAVGRFLKVHRWEPHDYHICITTKYDFKGQAVESQYQLECHDCGHVSKEEVTVDKDGSVVLCQKLQRLLKL